MVSNQTMRNHLASVGYNASLIARLWTLVAIPNSNLLTRNGFVAVCHMVDKISNSNFAVPSVLPDVLNSNTLHNLTTTPVHRNSISTLRSFPNIVSEITSASDNNINGNGNGIGIGIGNSEAIPSNTPAMSQSGMNSFDSNFLIFGSDDRKDYQSVISRTQNQNRRRHSNDFLGLTLQATNVSLPVMTTGIEQKTNDDIFGLNAIATNESVTVDVPVHRQSSTDPSLLDSETHVTPAHSPQASPAASMFEQRFIRKNTPRTNYNGNNNNSNSNSNSNSNNIALFPPPQPLSTKIMTNIGQAANLRISVSGSPQPNSRSFHNSPKTVAASSTLFGSGIGRRTTNNLEDLWKQQKTTSMSARKNATK
jgi:hypothetical protein